MQTTMLRPPSYDESSTRHTTQINTRINLELKRRGDAVFAAAGLTSSEAIRMLYEFAAANEHRPEVIARRLADPNDDERRAAQEKRERGLAAIDRIGALYDDALKQLGIDDPDPAVLGMPYDQLKERAYANKYGIGE